MGSREREPTTSLSPSPRHQPHLSSLVVRPSESGGDSSDYEPGEVTRDPPPSYSRSERFPDNSGHGMRAASDSPLRHKKVDHHYRSDFDNFDSPHRGRGGFRGGRGPGRFRDSSPLYGRGRGGGRSYGRGYNRFGFDPEPFRTEGGTIRNNPNVAPREGDWICSDPSCGNLNFARRDFCNKCNRPRFGPGDSPRRNYPGPPPRLSGPLMDRSPGRGDINGYRSPPRDWGRNGPRDFRTGPPHTRHHGGRFPDQHLRRERPDYREEDYRERVKFDRPIPPEWGQRDRGRDNFNEKRGYSVRNVRRSLSPLPPPPPPPPPTRGRWVRNMRERSRSPMRGGPPKDYRRDAYGDRGRGNRWGMARDRMGEHPY